MNSYIEEDLLPQEAERLEYTQGVLSKLKVYQNKQLRESTGHLLRETDRWAYFDRHDFHPCPGYHYFDMIVDKYVNKPFSCVIAKCRNHVLYRKHKGFKQQVDRQIRKYLAEPARNAYYYFGQPTLDGEHYVDREGILRDIKDHPDYFVAPCEERIVYRSWNKPQYTTTSRKKILRDVDGIHYFVSSFEDDSKIPVYSKDGAWIVYYKKNENSFKIPLTKSELNKYTLFNNYIED